MLPQQAEKLKTFASLRLSGEKHELAMNYI